MKEFKPILLFLLKFVLVGFVLVIVYNLYLNHYHSRNLPDPYSKFIATCTVSTLETAGFESMQLDDEKKPWVWVGIDGKWASYINEGCNAVSIMIIFISFVVAFSTTWKPTTLYILAGLAVIQIMNVLRIAWLNYIFIYHEEYKKIAHDYLFPAIIYGTIVVLWIIWVKFFALKTKTNE
ncbi:MAG: exosortase family protein XrtF [Weeksellaceae bacterium]|jgi:exosortase family protein XrtF|nr:exosortase family protein XrtF [Weeksellaceae bacterium]MDX9704174.1 exosortase family protein XrtF [Weeksellaceae bacterium]